MKIPHGKAQRPPAGDIIFSGHSGRLAVRQETGIISKNRI
jgi:hypothetical protein